MASVSSPMPSASAAATPSFDLPAMPGSYEDFEFSLNLPENVTASDLNLVASPDFSHLFGLSSGPSTSNIFSSGATPPAGTTLKSSAPSTPKAHETDDTVMSHSLSNEGGSGGKTESGSGGAPSSETSSATAKASSFSTPASSSALGLEPQPTSMPLNASYQQQAATAAPFAAQSSGLLGSFGHQQHSQIPSGFHHHVGGFMQQQPNAFAPHQQQEFYQQQQRQQQMLMLLQQQQQQQLQRQQLQQQQQLQGAGLFDASETSFLTNFLSGFEGWDFNPNLPTDLPSFADAEKLAYQSGSPTTLTEGRRNSRQRSAGAMRNAKGSPRTTFGSASNHMSPGRSSSDNAAFVAGSGGDMTASEKKKMKTNHRRGASVQDSTPTKGSTSDGGNDSTDKRSNHILSEQRRRNHIREAFKELVDLLEAGREFGARGLGLSSGAGTGIEDEGLDDRSDYESTLEDEEPSATTKRRKFKARKRAALEAARKAGAHNAAAAASLLNGGGGRGKGRGRGGSAGGGAGSKSAVLFQAVDLLQWLDGRNAVLTEHVAELEEAVAA